MKISELIKLLEGIKSKDGNLTIAEISWFGDSKDPGYIEADSEDGRTYFFRIKRKLNDG